MDEFVWFYVSEAFPNLAIESFIAAFVHVVDKVYIYTNNIYIAMIFNRKCCVASFNNVYSELFLRVHVCLNSMCSQISVFFMLIIVVYLSQTILRYAYETTRTDLL